VGKFINHGQEDRPDNSLSVPAKRQSVIVARGRGGRTLVCSVAFSLVGAWKKQAEKLLQPPSPREMSQHHHISSKYLGFYAAEMEWRENNRRVSNGAPHEAATGVALGYGVSRVWVGYWQRS